MADGSRSADQVDDVVTSAKGATEHRGDLMERAGQGAFGDYQEDCRKKRCVDRYDSSESSDSGVATLSCTDCSGSSTASSDIADPGSPFSTGSTHSEDSALQPSTKMPPTQSAHHSPWPWTTLECPSMNNKRSTETEKTAFPKRLKSDTEDLAKQQSPPCLLLPPGDSPPQPKKRSEVPAKQGKITEYFKSQVKVHHAVKKVKHDQQTQFNGVRMQGGTRHAAKKAEPKKKFHQVTVPRKILPAPSKPQVNFAPTVTLTAVGFPPNLTYIHTKTPKPPDQGPIFVPQFATITNDKIGTIPILNRTQCLNVIHQPVPHQKYAAAAINNFNCVKLNATVVPIVKLNALPAVPATAAAAPEAAKCRLPADEKEAASPAAADSDSGVSSFSSFKEGLEVAVGDGEAAVPAAQKSPILSQPKTIRFPPTKREAKEEAKDAKATHTQESGLCRWAECNAQFDTSGALLEHLQLKHVISQATQEQYVCLWLGCKVHGRTSCSRSWLERHVLAHAGTKPFRCIVDGCGHRFNSQLTLERHVNGHFTGDGSQNGSAKKSTENSTTKLFKRNGKKIRFRRQPWSARMFDFIDSGIMEGLQHKLLTMTQDRTLGQIHNAGNTVNVFSKVVARRVEPDGRVKFLVRWHPVDIIPDEWVTEKEYVPTKSVPIPSLNPSAKATLNSRFFPPETKRAERRRKPITKQQT